MKLFSYQELDSTQSTARRMATGGNARPFTVVAGIQSHGRGRGDKTWLSPPGGLWLTTALDVPSAEAVQQAAMVAAQGVAAVVHAQTGLQTLVKWPNDLLINHRKVCGILAETLVSPGQTILLLGVGLNVNNELPLADLPLATSLRLELGHAPDVEQLGGAIAETLESGIDTLVRQGFQAFWPWIRDHLALRGQVVTIEFNNQRDTGRILGLTETGALLLETSDGSPREISAGSIYFW